jgi:hypothetical protein
MCPVADPIREALEQLADEVDGLIMCSDEMMLPSQSRIGRVLMVLASARAALAAQTAPSYEEREAVHLARETELSRRAAASERLLACATEIKLPDGWVLCQLPGDSQWTVSSGTTLRLMFEMDHFVTLGTDPLEVEKRLRAILAKRGK